MTTNMKQGENFNFSVDAQRSNPPTYDLNTPEPRKYILIIYFFGGSFQYISIPTYLLCSKKF